MEFIKVGKNYMIKNSNGIIVSEKEKLELENKELTLTNQDCACIDKIKKVSKNKKRLKKIIEEENTATTEKEVDVDETIKETDTTI